MHKMAYELAKPLAAQRAQRRLIHGSLLQTVKTCFDLQEPAPPASTYNIWQGALQVLLLEDRQQV